MKRIYKSISLLAIFTALFSVTGLSQNAWINEFHYDNLGLDTNEFIEVVIANPGNYNLADFSVVLYNGNNGASYNTKTLDLFTPGATSGNYTFYYLLFPANGIQNGAPDGIALVYLESVIPGQWLSYEGTMTAVDGPASGMLSVDILVLEPGTDPPGLSLQLTGTGIGYGDFTWLSPAATTMGQLNNGQSLGGGVPPVADFTGTPTSLHAGETVNFTDLSTGTPAFWQWEFEGGQPATSSLKNPTGISYPVAGVYNVKLTVSNNYGQNFILKTDYIDVLPLGVKEQSKNSFNIYPNPNHGSFMIFNSFDEEMTLSVYSSYGQLLTETLVSKGDNSIDLSGYAKGIYMVRFSSKDGKSTGTDRVIIY